MFTSGSHSAVSPGEKTLRDYLINSTCMRAPFDSFVTENTTEGVNGQNIKKDGLDWTRPTDVNTQMWSDGKAVWETLKEHGNRTCVVPCPRPFCGHTTCGLNTQDACLYQTYDTANASDIERDRTCPENTFRPDGEEKLQWEGEMEGQLARGGAQEGDMLHEIDFSLRQLLDAEMEAFRVNVHNLVSEHHQQYRQLLVIENEAVKDQRNLNNPNEDSTCAWSPMNLAEQPQIEESSNSSYSIQDEDSSQHYRSTVILDEDANRILIRLLTSASKVTHALRREEYET